MPPEEPWETLARALANGDSEVVFSMRDLAPALDPAPGEAGGGETAEPGHARPELATPYVAPRGRLEEQLAAIWQNLLGIGGVRGPHQFFELGGRPPLPPPLVSRV